MDTSHDIIVNLLHNLGSRREIDQYLASFTGVDSARFAVIKVGGGILTQQLDELASALAFLKRIGLCPVVIHGAGPQLSTALEAQGVQSEWIKGQRVTTPVVLSAARKIFQQEGAKLADALDRNGVRARPITSGVFRAQPSSINGLGLVGEIDSVNVDLIRATIESGHLPIVSSLGESDTGQILNVNADIAARELALALRPRKIVFLTPTGGLLDDKGAVIPAINLEEDFDRLMREPWVHGGMALKLEEIKRLLDQLPEHTSVSITSPEHLAKELFTHKGMGTLIRRGVSVRLFDSIDDLDRDRLRTMIESSFGRTLREDYFESRDIDRVLVAGDYVAGAVLTRADGIDLPYLDKFAVSAQAQGVGLGASLWARLMETAPRLFWRARQRNPINPWYFERADGTIRRGAWIIFWRGIDSRHEIERCVRYAEAQPDSFAPAPRVMEVAGV